MTEPRHRPTGQARSALLIALTGLRRSVRSRAFIITTVVGPILLAGIISLAFGGGSDFQATIGIVDEDGSAMTEGFVTALTGADMGGLEVERVDSVDAARTQVDDDDLSAAIVLPAGFGASARGPAPADVEVLTASDRGVGGEVARSIAGQLTDRVNAARLAVATASATGAPLPDEDELAAIELPVTVEATGSGGDTSPAAYFGPSMGLLFLFLSVGTIARQLLEEKRNGLLDRLRSGPLSDGALLAGNGLTVLVIGASSLSVIWLATTVAMGADWGDPVGVALLIAAAAVAVAGLAGFIAAVATTEQAADTLATVLAFVFAIVGGAFIPLGDMPEALQRVALLTPTGLALRGFAELSVGEAGALDVAPYALALVAIGLVAGTIAARLLPRRLGAT